MDARPPLLTPPDVSAATAPTGTDEQLPMRSADDVAMHALR